MKVSTILIMTLKVHAQSTPRELGTTQSLDRSSPSPKAFIYREVLELASADISDPPDDQPNITLPLVETLRHVNWA